MRLLARLHCGLIVACVLAAAFDALSLTGLVGEVSVVAVYLRGLLFGVSVALSYYAAERLSALWQFLLASVVLCGLSWLMLGNPIGAVMAAIVCFFRLRVRLSEEKEKSAFEEPNFVCLIPFALSFCLSAVYELPLSQKLSVFSAVMYLLVVLTYRAVRRIDEYLVLNKSMKELPTGRILRIAGAAVGAFLLIAVILLAPSALSIPGNIVFALPDVPGKPYTGPAEVESLGAGMSINLEEVMGDEVQPLFHIPEFVIYLVYVFVGILLAAAILYGVYQLFKNFRFSYADNRDVIESLSADPDVAAHVPAAHRQKISVLDRSPNAAIRRKYRKAVLKASKEAPKRWKTPTEIESDSGINELRLHELYEKARYGSEPCTSAELRSLK